MYGALRVLNSIRLSKGFSLLLSLQTTGVIILSILLIPHYNVIGQGISNNTTLEVDLPISIALSSDKFRYLTGEPVVLLGVVNNGSSSSISEKILIKVNYIGNTSKIPNMMAPPESGASHVVYNASTYPINNSFSAIVLDTFRSGTYQVSAIIERTGDTAATTFQVENPFTTIFAFVIYAGVGLLIIFLIVLLRESARVSIIQVANFVFLSGLVGAISVALLLGDVEIGSNSPIGLVIQGSVPNEGQVNPIQKVLTSEQGSWVINIGGTQNNSYKDGIQIPIYVFILGLWGGYLRYLYETATTVRKTLDKESKKIEDYVDSLDDSKIDATEVRIGRFERTHPEIREELKASPKQDLERLMEQRMAKRYVLRTRLERRYYLFQSLKNISLLLLAPLLSMAIWFLLVQAGIEDTSLGNNDSQSGLFILAAISITVGLVTNEAIQVLVNFAKDRFGRVEEETSLQQQLSFDINDLKSPVNRNSEQTFTLAVLHDGSPIEDAIVKGKASYQAGAPEHKFGGLTDSSGKYSHSWSIDAEAPIGIYNMKINVSASGFKENSVSTSYQVL